MFFIVFVFQLNLTHLVYSKINNTKQVLQNVFEISSLNENFNSEIITITESYDCSFNTVFLSNFVSQFAPVSDTSDYLKYLPGFSSVRSRGTNADIVFSGVFLVLDYIF